MLKTTASVILASAALSNGQDTTCLTDCSVACSSKCTDPLNAQCCGQECSYGCMSQCNMPAYGCEVAQQACPAIDCPASVSSESPVAPDLPACLEEVTAAATTLTNDCKELTSFGSQEALDSLCGGAGTDCLSKALRVQQDTETCFASLDGYLGEPVAVAMPMPSDDAYKIFEDDNFCAKNPLSGEYCMAYPGDSANVLMPPAASQDWMCAEDYTDAVDAQVKNDFKAFVCDQFLPSVGCCLGTILSMMSNAPDSECTTPFSSGFFATMCGVDANTLKCGDATVASTGFGLPGVSVETYTGLSDQEKQDIISGVTQDLATAFGVDIQDLSLKVIATGTGDIEIKINTTATLPADFTTAIQNADWTSTSGALPGGTTLDTSLLAPEPVETTSVTQTEKPAPAPEKKDESVSSASSVKVGAFALAGAALAATLA